MSNSVLALFLEELKKKIELTSAIVTNVLKKWDLEKQAVIIKFSLAITQIQRSIFQFSIFEHWIFAVLNFYPAVVWKKFTLQ